MSITIYDQAHVLGALTKAIGKPGIFISFVRDSESFTYTDLMLAAPFLNIEEHGQIMLDGCGYIVCDDYAEMLATYAQIVGDDGPTPMNPYDGPVRVYALTFNADGETENENT